MKDHTAKKGALHEGPRHSSPYPLSRLAPPMDLVDLAKEIEQADLMLAGKVNAQLAIIADQIRTLRDEARRILREAQKDKDLHRAHCSFQKRSGQTYHLYEKANGTLYFSLLTPADWQNKPPHSFCGSFKLEADYSWTLMEGDYPSG
jgi:hypothetical protein